MDSDKTRYEIIKRRSIQRLIKRKKNIQQRLVNPKHETPNATDDLIEMIQIYERLARNEKDRETQTGT